MMGWVGKMAGRIWASKPMQPVVQLFERVLAWYWSTRTRDLKFERVAGSGPAPSDNLQISMNLIMPLADPTAVGRANVMGAIAGSIDEVFVGMNNVGTVHFARFDIVQGNLCMFSIFDGDPRAYIRDFIVMFGGVFNTLMGVVKDPPPTPCEDHVDDFLEWVMARDAFSIPGGVTQMFPDLHKAQDAPRDLVMLMRQHDNVQLGIYRGCPGFSVSQMRWKMGVGW